MKAVKIVEAGEGYKAVVATDAKLAPGPRADEIVVKTVAVALNPTDWKHVKYGITGATVGCDLAGVVHDVGTEVTRFKKGDRVWGMAHGSCQNRPDSAAFQELVFVKEGMAALIPDGMSFEDASSLGVGIITTGQGMYQEMPTQWPDQPLEKKVPFLIWGGSSATGAIGIQFAKLSGYEVITTCSPHNFDYVKSLGADVVFNSRSPIVGEEIRAYTNDKLYYVWDTIGEHGSEEACAKALASSAPEGQKLYYGSIMMKKREDFLDRNGKLAPRPDDVVYSVSLGYSAAGEAFDIKTAHFPARPEDYVFSKKWITLASELLAQGKIRPHRTEVREGGYEGILSGLDDLKDGKVSGVKLVYRIGEP